jgi:hypothetical protein
MGYTAPHSYHMSLGTYNGSPADSLTYFFGAPWDALNTVEYYTVFVPRAGTIREVVLSAWTAGVGSSAENTTFKLRKNGADVATLYTGSIAGTTGNYTRLATINADVSVAQNDYITISMVTPAWATNPTGLRILVELMIDYS